MGLRSDHQAAPAPGDSLPRPWRSLPLHPAVLGALLLQPLDRPGLDGREVHPDPPARPGVLPRALQARRRGDDGPARPRLVARTRAPRPAPREPALERARDLRDVPELLHHALAARE